MKILKELTDYIDLSDYPKDHPNYDATNKTNLVISKME